MQNDLKDNTNEMKRLHYNLTKEIMKKYDYKRTKENVESLIEKYKIAKYQYLASESNLYKITSYYQIKYEQRNISKSDRVGSNVTKIIDSKNMIDSFETTFRTLLKIMPRQERKYCISCLINNNSEQSLANILNIPISGLQTIKKNCILKIALTFHIEVFK